jgi:hypothetical protein
MSLFDFQGRTICKMRDETFVRTPPKRAAEAMLGFV